MTRLSILSIPGAVLILGVAVLSGAFPVLAQGMPSTDAIERMARVVTDLDPAIKTIELRGKLAPGDNSAGTISFYFRYQSPDQYAYFAALNDDPAAYVASSGNKYLVYRFSRGDIVLLDNTVPVINFQSKEGSNSLNLGFITLEPSAKEPVAKLRIELPTMLLAARNAGARAPEIEAIGDGTYRLTYTSKKGSRFSATVDPSLPFAYTGLQIHGETRPIVAIEIRVNQMVSSGASSLPSLQSIRSLFAVDESVKFEGVSDFAGILEIAWTPMAVAAGPDSEDDGMRKEFEKQIGKKQDWEALEAQYKRDLPKLRKLLPMPRWTNR